MITTQLMPDESGPLAGLCVLFVEDEPLIAVMLEEYAQDMGCRFCQTIGTVPAAIEALDTIGPDIVILDVTLSGSEPDFSIADELMGRHIPFIFCSGHNRDILPARHRDRPFLSKPFSSTEIADALSQSLLSGLGEKLRRAGIGG